MKLAEKIEDVLDFKGVCVVIDFFRFSTTVSALLSRQKNIVVCSEVKKAYEFYQNGYSIFSEKELELSRFDNSPYLAYTSNFGVNVCVITESGSKAVMACKNACDIVIASLSNASAVKRYIYGKSDVLIIPACIFFNRSHIEDFIFSKYLKDYINDKKDLDVNDVYNNIFNTGRINELIKQRKTAFEDLKIIFSKDIFDIIPRAKISCDFAEVR